MNALDTQRKQSALLNLKVVSGNFKLTNKREQYTSSQKEQLKDLYKKCKAQGWTEYQIIRAVGNLKL